MREILSAQNIKTEASNEDEGEEALEFLSGT
jgi:hypothetical protein